MPQVLEENGLSTRQEENFELATTAMIAAAQSEVQAAIIIAKRFPRNEDQALAKLLRSCQRGSFAETTSYKFPRGGTQVTGPTICLAREAARIWGNIEYGLLVTHDDDETRVIRAWAWDKETNTKTFAEDSFQKLIQRKDRSGIAKWVKPDERDLRELTNRRGAILVRNCLLQLLPKDLVEDALAEADKTKKNDAKADPEGTKKKIIRAFMDINVTPEMLEQYLKHPLAQCSPEELAELREIYQSIRDGNSKWSEYMEEAESESGNGNGKKGTEKGSLSMDDLQGKPEEPKKEELKKEAKKPVDVKAESSKSGEELTPDDYVMELFKQYSKIMKVPVEKAMKDFTPKGNLNDLSLEQLNQITKALEKIIRKE